MTMALVRLFSVMLLIDPGEQVDVAASEEISRDAERVQLAAKPGRKGAAVERREIKEAHITSRSCDYDRYEGVVMFEGNVVVRYDRDYSMCSDRLYMLMKGSNAVSRVVALGNVSITNDSRVGTCAMAVYRRARGEIEMFADAKNGVRARLRDTAGEQSEVSGARIRFWLDSEQVEIGDSDIRMKGKKEDRDRLL